MAQRRMFSPQIVESEEFLTMPTSSQALYFHLGMGADDDGFIQPKMIMRQIGSADDDLKVLLAKRFILPFESGVVVIKHWLIHNLIQKDRYHPTRFQEERNTLLLKDNKSYTEKVKPVNRMLPEVRLGKVKLLAAAKPSADREITLSKESEEEERPKKETRSKDKELIYRIFSSKPQPWWIFYQEKKSALSLFDLVGFEKVQRGKQIMKDHEDDPLCPQAATPCEYAAKLPKLARYIKRNGL